MCERHRWTEEETALLIQTHRTHSVAEQVRLLGLTPGQVLKRRRTLYEKGLLHASQRKLFRAWTDDETEQLRLLLLDGKTTPTIARVLRRSRQAIENRVAELGGFIAIRATPHAQVRALAQVSILFGLSPGNGDRVSAWIRHGWLRCSSRPKSRPKSPRYVTDEALRQFLTNRFTWPSWRPDEITDPEWRDYARDIRTKTNGEWWSFATWAKHCYYSASTIYNWLYAGLLAEYQTTRWGNHWYIWSEDVLRFAPPSQRNRNESRQI